MLPSEAFEDVFNKWMRISSAFVGLEIFNPNFKITFLTIYVHAGIITTIFSLFYTMYMYDIKITIQCIGILGVVSQVIAQYFIASKELHISVKS